jgi:hypothetical protein
MLNTVTRTHHETDQQVEHSFTELADWYFLQVIHCYQVTTEKISMHNCNSKIFRLHSAETAFKESASQEVNGYVAVHSSVC